VFVCLVLATVSGRWTKDRELMDVWEESGLWSSCTACTDNERGACTRSNNYINTVKAFSVIAAVAEFLAVFGLIYEFFYSRGNANVYNGVLLMFVLAIAANIVSWTTFAGFFRRDNLCIDGQESFADNKFKLSWGYALRLVELGVLVVAALLTFMNKGKAERHALHTVALLVAIFLLMLTILSTSGRGWMWTKYTGAREYNGEVGLWDSCQCREQFNNPCRSARGRVQTTEVFSVVAIFFQFVFIVLLCKADASTSFDLTLQRVAAVLSTIAQVIVIVVFSEYAKTSYCDGFAITDAQRLHWAYGISCVGLIVEVIAIIVHFTIRAHPVEAKKPTEVANEPATV